MLHQDRRVILFLTFAKDTASEVQPYTLCTSAGTVCTNAHRQVINYRHVMVSVVLGIKGDRA